MLRCWATLQTKRTQSIWVQVGPGGIWYQNATPSFPTMPSPYIPAAASSTLPSPHGPSGKCPSNLQEDQPARRLPTIRLSGLPTRFMPIGPSGDPRGRRRNVVRAVFWPSVTESVIRDRRPSCGATRGQDTVAQQGLEACQAAAQQAPGHKSEGGPGQPKNRFKSAQLFNKPFDG